LKLRNVLPLLVAIFLAVPFPAAAFEQSFAQSGLKTSIRLTPDQITTGKEVNINLMLEKDGQTVTDRKVSLEVYAGNATEPAIKRDVDILGDEYVDSWSFEKPGDYKVVVNIADPQKPDEALHYEVKASVGDVKDVSHEGHEEHGFFAHHFGGGKWGWWGTGLMLVIMVPMMVIML